jgi:hypothetical protein
MCKVEIQTQVVTFQRLCASALLCCLARQKYQPQSTLKYNHCYHASRSVFPHIWVVFILS